MKRYSSTISFYMSGFGAPSRKSRDRLYRQAILGYDWKRSLIDVVKRFRQWHVDWSESIKYRERTRENKCVLSDQRFISSLDFHSFGLRKRLLDTLQPLVTSYSINESSYIVLGGRLLVSRRRKEFFLLGYKPTKPDFTLFTLLRQPVVLQ